MEQPVIITSYDGNTTIPVVRLNVPSGANGGSGVINLGNGAKTFLALTTQSTTEDPNFSDGIGLNTLSGTPVFARTSAGLYTLTLTGAWTQNKTYVEWTNGNVGTPTTAGVVFAWARTSANVLTLKGFDVAGSAADWDQLDAVLRITVLP
jgi:hypothetical protein